MNPCFVNPANSYYLGNKFCFYDYREAEKEYEMLFPEYTGFRLGFIQMGITAWLTMMIVDDGSPLEVSEFYSMQPHTDACLHPTRILLLRRLTVEEFRMIILTSVKLTQMVGETVLQHIGRDVAGESLYQELKERGV